MLKRYFCIFMFTELLGGWRHVHASIAIQQNICKIGDATQPRLVDRFTEVFENCYKHRTNVD